MNTKFSFPISLNKNREYYGKFLNEVAFEDDSDEDHDLKMRINVLRCYYKLNIGPGTTRSLLEKTSLMFKYRMERLHKISRRKRSNFKNFEREMFLSTLEKEFLYIFILFSVKFSTVFSLIEYLFDDLYSNDIVVRCLNELSTGEEFETTLDSLYLATTKKKREEKQKEFGKSSEDLFQLRVERLRDNKKNKKEIVKGILKKGKIYDLKIGIIYVFFSRFLHENLVDALFSYSILQKCQAFNSFCKEEFEKHKAFGQLELDEVSPNYEIEDSLIFYIKAELDYQQGDYKEAEESYSKLLQIELTEEALNIHKKKRNKYYSKVSKSRLYKKRGDCFSEINELEKAITDYSKAIQMDPVDSFLFSIRSDVYTTMKKYQKALEDCNSAIRLSEEVAYYYFQRSTLLCRHIKNYRLALVDINKALQLKHNSHAYYFNIKGEILKRLKKYKKSLQAYSKAVKIEPDSSDYFLNRAVIYKILDMDDKALKDYKKAKAICEYNIKTKPEKNLDFRYFFELSFCYGELKEFVKCIEILNLIEKMGNSSRRLYNDRAYYLSQIGKYQQALVDVEKCLEVSGKPYSNPLAHRGWCYLKMKRYEEAKETLLKGKELSQDYFRIHEYLGFYYFEMKEFNEAKKSFEMAQEIEPERSKDLAEKLNQCKKYLSEK